MVTAHRETGAMVCALALTRELDIDGPARVGAGLAAVGAGAFVVAAGGLDADNGRGEELLAFSRARAARRRAARESWRSTRAAAPRSPSSARLMNTLRPMKRRDHCRECW